jgi:hypothetical protein
MSSSVLDAFAMDDRIGYCSLENQQVCADRRIGSPTPIF